MREVDCLSCVTIDHAFRAPMHVFRATVDGVTHHVLLSGSFVFRKICDYDLDDSWSLRPESTPVNPSCVVTESLVDEALIKRAEYWRDHDDE